METTTWDLIGRLALGIFLSGVIGLEREIRQKQAGLRTHALVGLGAALIIEVSAYGFNGVVLPGKIVLDPSRVAAQVVSGIGFIGAGLIFVRQDFVRGLTTAASVWVTAAVGLAAGAGLWQIAVATTLFALAVVEGLELVEAWVRPGGRSLIILGITYPEDSETALDEIIRICDSDGSSIMSTELTRQSGEAPTVRARLTVNSTQRQSELARRLSRISGVLNIYAEQE